MTHLNPSRLLTLAFLTLSFFAACGNTKTGSHPAPSLDGPERITRDGAAILTRTDVAAPVRERLKREAELSNLVVLPSPGEFSQLNFFRLIGVPESRNAVFIAPRLYAFQAGQGGNLTVTDVGAGQVTLTFPIVLFSGLTSQMMSPTGGFFSLDDSLTLGSGESQRLIQHFRSIYPTGSDPYLAPLPGCPVSLRVVAQGKSYEAISSAFLTSDYCQADTPISVSFTLPWEDALAVLTHELDAGNVSVEAVFQTMAARQISRLHLRLDHEKFYRLLEFEFKAQAYGFKAEIQQSIRSILENYRAELQIQGIPSTAMNQLIQRSLDEFFAAFLPPPGSPLSDECGEIGCLKLKAVRDLQRNRIEVNWEETSNTLFAQNYAATTALKPIHHPGVTVGNLQYAPGRVPHSHDGVGAESVNLGLTLGNGALIRVQPNFFILEEPISPQGETTVTSNSVCVEHGWISSGLLPHERDPHGHREKVCVRYEDRWTSVTRYDVGGPHYGVETSPTGRMKDPWSDLGFEFTWWNRALDRTERLRCPLSAFTMFNPEISTSARTFHVTDQERCPYFRKAGGRPITLRFYNEVRETRTYRIGHETRAWDGRHDASGLRTQSFTVKTRFVGTISLLTQGWRESLPGKVVPISP